MIPRAWGEEYRTTTVCVDQYENGVPGGRIYNPYLDGGKSFQSLTQFLAQMEQALDTMDFPKAYATTRTFAEAPGQDAPPPAQEASPGKVATFRIKVLFRQNASWQGLVTWQEGRKEQSFRSVLELIFLLDSALGGAKES